jgi:hypothetical protein
VPKVRVIQVSFASALAERALSVAIAARTYTTNQAIKHCSEQISYADTYAFGECVDDSYRGEDIKVPNA